MKIIQYSRIAIYVAIPRGSGRARRIDGRGCNLQSRRSGSMIRSWPRQSLKSRRTRGVKAQRVNVDQNGFILKGYDPVAHFKQHRAVRGDPKYASSYGGATYYFTSADDKATFDEAPAKYAPQYGAYCAYGMTKGQLNDCNPNVFFIYKGKLYFCESPKKGRTFSSKPGANIRKADANWRTYEPPSNPGLRRQLVHCIIDSRSSMCLV